jgi:OOP family OmpA-OmpF porin
MSSPLTPAKLIPLAALPLLLAGLGCAQLRTLHRKHQQQQQAPPPVPAAAPAEPEFDPNAAPTPEPPPPPPAPKPELPAKVVLDGPRLRPVPHGWNLDPKGLAAVQQAARRALAYGPGLRVLVNGYTSTAGDRNRNLVLSRRRADVVAKALVKAGVPQDWVVARGFGPDKAIASNATREGRLRNLRVEVEFQAR